MRAALLRGLSAIALRRLSAVALMVIALAPSVAIADEPGVSIRLIAPERITAGDRVELIAEVTISPRSDLPVLLTPSNQGGSIEVVRGRLVRSDAEDPAASPLRFRVPLLANEPGTAIVRVRVMAYACAARCRTIDAEAEVTLTVASR